MIVGLFIDTLIFGFTHYVVSWSFQISKRPVKSISSSEIFTAGETIDIGKLIVNAYRSVYNTDIDLFIVIESKDLFTTLFTQRKSINRSNHRDVAVIRYKFETKTVSEMF